MKFLLCSNFNFHQPWSSSIERVINGQKAMILPLGMPLEMTSTDEWHSFYGEDGQLYDLIMAPFKHFDIDVQWMNIFESSKEAIHEQVQQSDIIVFPGGDVQALVSRYAALCLNDVIESYDGLIIGASAGAKCWFQHIFTMHDDENSRIWIEMGAGINYFTTKQVVAVHVDLKKDETLTIFQTLLQRQEVEQIIALGDDGAIVYDTNTEQLDVFGSVQFIE